MQDRPFQYEPDPEGKKRDEIEVFLECMGVKRSPDTLGETLGAIPLQILGGALEPAKPVST